MGIARVSPLSRRMTTGMSVVRSKPTLMTSTATGSLARLFGLAANDGPAQQHQQEKDPPGSLASPAILCPLPLTIPFMFNPCLAADMRTVAAYGGVPGETGLDQIAVQPPSTSNVCPVIRSAAGLDRKTTAPATSSGLPRRPSGMRLRTSLLKLSS